MDTGKQWPDGGEVDIIEVSGELDALYPSVADRPLEGVNTMTNNQAGLHTTPGCSMPANRAMKGSVHIV